ncbi:MULTISPECIES: type II toxin-antitoxin system RelE/ParE family toxin [unclassified Luteimonas]
MSNTSRRAAAGTEPRIERLQPWIAALLSALLHLLLALLAMSAAPVTMSNPEGSAGGSRIDVTFIDVADPIPSPPEQPPSPPETPLEPVPPREAIRPPATSPLQVTRVVQADESLPPDAQATRETAEPPASAAAPPRPRRHVRGQPPGMLPEHHAPVNAGPARSPATDRGRRYNASAAETNMEAGGFQVIYDLLGEARLREWRDAGMTELYLPLPGTRRLMVCPLETALRRESGPCRLVEPDDPGLAEIGDARKVITMDRVYRQGELLWSGPGPYR